MNKKSINTIYSCCSSTPWLEVVKKLDQELNVKPSYYIGWRGDGSLNIKDRYKNCFYQTIQDAWKGRGFPVLDYNCSRLDEVLLKSIAFEELVAIQMMDRLDADGNDFSFSDRKSFFYDLLKYWIVILDEYDIELIISPSIPHRVFDYVLYVAGRIKGVEFIMFQMTPFEDSSFIINDIEQTTDYFKNNIFSVKNDTELRKDIIERIDITRGDYLQAEPHYMKKQKKLLETTYWKSGLLFIKSKLMLIRFPFRLDIHTYRVQKKLSPEKSNPTRLDSFYVQYKAERYLKKLKKEYIHLCSDVVGSKYVFVALQYQPEETSCPTGGAFADQRLIVEVLNSFLGDTYEIIIKEHKTQFHPKYEGSTGRSRNFYENILKISNRIKFVDVNQDPFELIAGATATVTISGMIGWESVLRGTPSLIFGRAWYEDMVGVFKIKSKKDLKLCWEKVLTKKYNIDKNEVLDFHKGLQKYLINSNHYSSMWSATKRTEEENCLNIYIGIYNHLKNINFFT